MIISGAVMNLSNVYRATDAGAPRANRSAFLIQTWEAATLSRSDHIFVVCGDSPIDDAWANPIYLATIRRDGGYRIERAEPYLEPWKQLRHYHPERALNTRHLPDAVAGTTFHKALSYSKQTQYSFNRWRSGVVSENGCGALLEPEHSFEKYLRVDFADHALVCDGRAISRLELLPDRDDTHTDNGNDKVLMLAQQLLETPCEVSERQLRAWLAEYGCRIKADGKSVESK